MGNGSLLPGCSLSSQSLQPSLTVQLTVCSCLQSGLNIEPPRASGSACVGGAGGASEPPPNLPLATEPALSVLVHTSSFQKQPPGLRPTSKKTILSIQKLVTLVAHLEAEAIIYSDQSD